MIIVPSEKVLLLANWESVSKSREKGFLDFEFITWMAWTWQTAAFFVFIALCLTAMILWEKEYPEELLVEVLLAWIQQEVIDYLYLYSAVLLFIWVG